MGFILFLLIITIILIALLMLPLEFTVFVNLGNSGKHAEVYFLKIFKMSLVWDHNKPVFSVYLFKNKIYSSALKKERETGNLLLLLRSAVIANKKADIVYGMRSPFSTGLAFGALGFAAGFLNFDEMRMHPDFFADGDYLKAEGSAKIFIGNTIVNYAKNKRKQKWRENEWSKA